MADQYGLIPLPLGAPFEAPATEQANQPALPFSGYMAGWTAATGVAFSAALTEGADVLAAQVAVSVAASLAQTEGADVLAAAVGPQVAASAALSEGADVLSAQASPVVASSASLSEGADVLAAAVSLSAGALQFSADIAEGADVLAAQVGTTAVGGGYDDDDKPKRKRRFVVERNGKLVVYASQAAALQALEDASGAAQEPAQEADQPEVVDLPALQAYAELAGRLEDYTAAYNSRHFEQLMALFDQMQQDEEDIEMLLLAV